WEGGWGERRRTGLWPPGPPSVDCPSSLSPRPMMPASLCSATAISTRTATPLPQRNARGRGLLQVRDGVLGRGLALAAPAPLEDFARQVAAPQAEGERQGQDEPAEEDAEGDEHHVAADADLDQRP